MLYPPYVDFLSDKISDVNTHFVIGVVELNFDESQIDFLHFAGGQYFCTALIVDSWNKNFFNLDWDVVKQDIAKYSKSLHGVVKSETMNTLKRLHDIGYMPMTIESLSDGSVLRTSSPVLTIRNTHPDFAFLVEPIGRRAAEIIRILSYSTSAYAKAIRSFNAKKLNRMLFDLEQITSTFDETLERIGWINCVGISSSPTAVLEFNSAIRIADDHGARYARFCNLPLYETAVGDINDKILYSIEQVKKHESEFHGSLAINMPAADIRNIEIDNIKNAANELKTSLGFVLYCRQGTLIETIINNADIIKKMKEAELYPIFVDNQATASDICDTLLSTIENGKHSELISSGPTFGIGVGKNFISDAYKKLVTANYYTSVIKDVDGIHSVEDKIVGKGFKGGFPRVSQDKITYTDVDNGGNSKIQLKFSEGLLSDLIASKDLKVNLTGDS